MLLPISSTQGLDFVDSDVFELKYFGACMDCTFCHDNCCQYGCDVNIRERDRILAFAEELKPYVETPAEGWFAPTVYEDPEYPTGKFVRANTVKGACVFLNRNGRGCNLHRFALETGRDYHQVKPMVCWLFPLCWDKKVLRPNTEVKDELVCRAQGISLYSAARSELEVVFGERLTAELDRLVPR